MLALRKKAEDAASALPALMIRAERAAMNIFHGEHAQRKSGRGEKFWQFREYMPQDRPQDIDWKQSGKTDRIFIRQKERQLPQTALFWACAAESMEFSSSTKRPSKADAANILILALAILMTHGGERVGMLGSSQTGRSDNALENIGNILLSERHHESLPSSGPARTQKNSTLVLAGDFLNPLPEIETSFKNLAGQTGGGLVIQILDPAEIDLPWNGRAIFKDPAQAHRELVQNIPSIREAYKQRIQDHVSGVQKLCRDCGWHYMFHRTDTPYEHTLLKIWAQISALREKGAA